MTEQTVKDVLVAARKKIENDKDWGKGIRGSGLRPLETCCAAEAIEEVTGYKLRRDAFKALYKGIGITCNSIVNWNDAPERTHADVLAAFDKAIALA